MADHSFCVPCFANASAVLQSDWHAYNGQPSKHGLHRCHKHCSVLQLDVRLRFSQRCKTKGVVRNCKQEDQLIRAAQAAEHISNDSVTLPSDPAQPALVTSQQDSSTRYNVSGSCTYQPSCSCAMGSQGAMCKHIVKVIHLQTGRSLYDIVLSLGIWAGSCKGDMDKLLDPSKPEQFSNSWADTAAAFDCEEELEQHEQRVESSSTLRDSGSNASTSAADRDNDSAVTAHFHKLLADRKGNPEMRGIIVSSLRQAEGSFREMKARGGTPCTASTQQRESPGWPHRQQGQNEELLGSRLQACQKDAASSYHSECQWPATCSALQQSQAKQQKADLSTGAGVQGECQCSFKHSRQNYRSSEPFTAAQKA